MNFNQHETPLAVSAECVGMALPFRAERDVRFYLNGIYIAPDPSGGAVIVATDNKAMAVVYDEDGRAPVGGMILPIGRGQASVLRKGGRLFADAEGRAFVTNASDAIVWIAADLKVQGDYPDFSRVLPPPDSLEPGLLSTCNPVLLDRIRRAREAQARSKYSAGTRWWHQKSDPYHGASVASIADNAIAVVMPLRDGEWQCDAADYYPPSLRGTSKHLEAA